MAVYASRVLPRQLTHLIFQIGGQNVPDDLIVRSSSVGSNAAIDVSNDVDRLHLAAVEVQADAPALLQRHPDYEDRYKKWEKYRDCYSATDIYRFLHKHPREALDMWENRVRRGYFRNYCSSVVDLFVAYLFHAPIDRDPGDSLRREIEEFYKDANLSGTTYEFLMQQVATVSQVYGHALVLVDAPKSDVPIESEEHRNRLGIRPYLTVFTPLDLLDWEVDRYGKFTWVKLRVNREAAREWRTSCDTQVEHFLIWTRENWEEWELRNGDAASLVDSGEHDLGEVPLVVFKNEKDIEHLWFGLSAIRDIADINIAILNWSSLGDEEIFERCLNILAMQKSDDGSVPVQLSHNNVLEFSGETVPSYLTPGETPLKLIREWISDGKDEIYRLAKLGGSTGLMGVREATSGIAYAFEFNETNQSLAKKAHGMEQGEIEIHRLYALWLGKSFDGRVVYPKEFGIEDFLHELQILTESRTALSSSKAIKELEVRLVNKMFSQQTTSFRAEVAKEIRESSLSPVGVSETFDTVPQNLVRPQVSDSGV